MDHCTGSTGEEEGKLRIQFETKTGLCISLSDRTSGCACDRLRGQGKDEEVTEAYAMAQYLENAGIDRERIVQEDVSVNTLENLKFFQKTY